MTTDTAMAVLAFAGLLVAVAAFLVPLIVVTTLRSRDLKIATLEGQLQGLKDVIESLGRAFVDRRSHD